MRYCESTALRLDYLTTRVATFGRMAQAAREAGHTKTAERFEQNREEYLAILREELENG